MSSLIANTLKGLLTLVLLAAAGAGAEDIDIFAGTTEVDPDLPNVIFVLDNSANWARQSQKWPGGLQQGQSEVRAIKTALAAQTGNLNVGIVEYSTQGNASNNEGGYVRFNLQTLTDQSFTDLSGVLDKIFDDINDPEEKRSQGNAFGYLPYDFYNYLAGDDQSKSGAGTPGNLADTDAYSSQFDVFRSPLEAADLCVDTYMIFIGNNVQSGPSSDDSTNSNALKALYADAGVSAPDALAGDNGTPLAMPEFSVTVEEEEGEDVGVTTSCYASAAACTAAVNDTGGMCEESGNCSCTFTVGKFCSNNKGTKYYQWQVESGGSTTTTVEATGGLDTTGGGDYNLDDWAKFLHNYGIPITATTDDGETVNERIEVTTYTIDVFNAQSHPQFSGLLFSAANAGGGRYFQARSEDQIVDAINSALGDILAVNTSFAAVTLPLSATNRARVDNQVYIGMFRPSKGKKPRWFGNLKRYQLGLFNGVPQLADVRFNRAINPLTGFAAECAQSFWTTDTGDYWEDLGIDPAPNGKGCLDDNPDNDWSDLPDGPFVEKGGVGQQIREVAGGADARPIYTVDGNELVQLVSDDGSAMGGAEVLNYFRGSSAGADEVMPDAGLRASVHGDVIHSRPLTVSYGDGLIRLFYGANDGLYREVNAADGAEKWALVPPEHFPKLERLRDNAPLIKYSGIDGDVAPDYIPKDYFFDGSTGQLTVYDDLGQLELAYIYPTMRRGGRMVYALDVSDPDTPPSLLWRQGCSGESAGTCTSGFEDIGQTWSTPVTGFAAGYLDDNEEPKPVVMFGGGFDECLNADQAAYPSGCSSPRGNAIYILDAASGVLLKTLATDGPVISELSPIDINFDGTLDFVYATDAAGGIYRVSLAGLGDFNPTDAVTALEPDDWTIDKIGQTSGDERRFYNAPTAAPFRGLVFVTVGSGDRERPLESNYPYAEDVQNRFYALIDRPYLESVSVTDLDGPSMIEVTADAPDEPLDPNEPPIVLSETSGWYMDLPDRGEQVANASAIAGGKVFFNTFQPGGASTGICTQPLGVGKGYTVDLFAPEATTGNEIAGGGMPIPPIIATVKIPPAIPCEGDSCEPPNCDDPDTECEIKTVCIGCEGFEPIEVIPTAPPIRSRVYWTEDIDRD